MPLLNILAQTIAALLIFVIGYLALLFSALAGMVLAFAAYKGSRLLWSRAMARAASAAPGPARAAHTPSL